MEMKGAKILIESLKKEGVDVIFGYPGGAVLDIYDELYKQKDIRHILVRHEQGASHMADGYARTTGKVGVCFATSGPGATNLVTGLATAHMDSIPIVAITGQVNIPALGKDAFQEADMTGITMPITKHNYLVKDVKDMAKTIKEAFHLARSGRPGPVLIDLPKDVTQARCEFKYPKEIDMPTYKPTMKGHPKQIKSVIEMIGNAKKPLVLAGGGILRSGASPEFKAFIKKTKLPVSMTLMGMGCFPSHDPLSVGMPGMHGTAFANFAICESDLLIAIGMRFDDRITGKVSEFAKKAKIIHIDIDPAEINKVVKADLPVIGDAKEILKELNKVLVGTKIPAFKEWHEQLNGWKKKHPLFFEKSEKIIKPQIVMQAINELTKGEAIIVTEVGEHQMWAAQFIEFKKPDHFASSGGLGTMGYGLPAAIGASIGNPDKLVIDVSGDGSFQMNLQELGTISTHKIPVKILIMNNGYLGMVRQWQEMFYGKRYSQTDLKECQPDFMKLAAAYDIKGVTITKPSEVKAQLKKVFAHKGPVLVDIRIEREENVYPMVPAGGLLDKMMFHEAQYKKEFGKEEV